MIDVSHITMVLSVPTLLFLWKIVRQLSRMEFKLELLWTDYSNRKDEDDKFRNQIERRLKPR